MADNEPVRIFLLDDHEIVREGIRHLVEMEDDLIVVGEAATSEQAVARVPATQPDLAVLDVRLPDGDGVEVCRELRSRFPDLRCVMLTSFSDDEALERAIVAGASGYLLKQLRGRDLVEALREVAAGKSLIDEFARRRALERMQEVDRAADPGARLTSQENKILDLIADGCTNREIGERLYLAEKTVKNYVSNILAKLNMHHRSEAAAYAARLEVRDSRSPRIHASRWGV